MRTHSQLDHAHTHTLTRAVRAVAHAADIPTAVAAALDAFADDPLGAYIADTPVRRVPSPFIHVTLFGC